MSSGDEMDRSPKLNTGPPDLDELSSLVDEGLGRAYDAGGFLNGVAFALVGDAVSTMAWGHQLMDDPASTLWDVASLTKVMATWPLCGSLIEDGSLGLGTRLEELFDGADLPGGEIRVVDLLTHTSALCRRTRLDLYDEHQRRHLARTMMAQDLVGLPGRDVCYISRGFILLGLIIEKLLQKSLSEAFETVGPGIGMRAACLHGRLLPPRTDDVISTGAQQGVVHDPNARLLGGAGHAGLFATLTDLVGFSRAVLDSYSGDGPISTRWTRASLVPLFPEGHHFRGLAWCCDVSPFDGSVTAYHYGYTGCGIFVSPERRLACGFLTDSVSVAEHRPSLKASRHAILLGLRSRSFQDHGPGFRS